MISNPEKKQSVRTAVGVGGRLERGSIAVALHFLCSNRDNVVISHQPVTTPGAHPDPVLLLDEFAGEVDVIRQSCKAWTARGVEWSLHGHTPVTDADKVSTLINIFCSADALPRRDRRLDMAFIPEHLKATLEDLVRCGFIDQEDNKLAIADQGLQKIRSAVRLSEPRLLFSLRPDLALTNRTVYEMVLLLGEGGMDMEK